MRDVDPLVDGCLQWLMGGSAQGRGLETVKGGLPPDTQSGYVPLRTWACSSHAMAECCRVVLPACWDLALHWCVGLMVVWSVVQGLRLEGPNKLARRDTWLERGTLQVETAWRLAAPFWGLPPCRGPCGNGQNPPDQRDLAFCFEFLLFFQLLCVADPKVSLSPCFLCSCVASGPFGGRRLARLNHLRFFCTSVVCLCSGF